MRLLQFAILTALVTVFGHAAPITQKPDANSGVEEDPVIAAGKTPPFSPSWHYCMTACDCSRFSKDKQPEEFFQCITNPNCEQCARNGMTPP